MDTYTSHLITQAAALIGDSEETNPEYFRANVELIAHASDWFRRNSNVDERKELVAGYLRRKIIDLTVPTIDSIGGGKVGHIMIYPRSNGTTHEWVVYVPPTRPEHFDLGGEEWDGQPILDADVLGPWDETTYSTLEAAITFLRAMQAEGKIVSNDGRVL